MDLQTSSGIGVGKISQERKLQEKYCIDSSKYLTYLQRQDICHSIGVFFTWITVFISCFTSPKCSLPVSLGGQLWLDRGQPLCLYLCPLHSFSKFRKLYILTHMHTSTQIDN